MLARLGRHWGWVLAYGVLTLLAAIAVLAWPGETLLVLAVLFGIQLIISGIFRFVAALASEDLTGGTRVLLALLGVLSVIIGLWAVRHALLTLLALTVFLGIFWVVNGVIDIFTALSHREMPDRGWAVADGRAQRGRGHHRARLPGPDPARPGRDPRHLAARLRHHGDHRRLPAPFGGFPGRAAARRLGCARLLTPVN